mgnify:CR=1 FL=1|tara:strand:+ start:393 stop:605 length:213 start_codon:yes stop_codon:yes gene_type:complete
MSNDALLHKYQDMTDKLMDLADDLGWEYDRMSSSGQETLDKIYKILGMETIPEIDLKILKEQQQKEKDNE